MVTPAPILSVDQVWQWLETVPDPEIPVISLVDLGIIRDVGLKDGQIIVTVSPTYSGCPATNVINADIEAALRQNGVENLKLKRQISPPWTTDWISQKGRDALQKYGIAPPQPGGTPASCPNCGSDDLERVSQFSSTPCKALWKCRECLEPFDYFKCI